jgi:hypothetical protein
MRVAALYESTVMCQTQTRVWRVVWGPNVRSHELPSVRSFRLCLGVLSNFGFNTIYSCFRLVVPRDDFQFKIQACTRIHWFSIRGLPRPKKELENWRNKRFVSFKTVPKRDRAVTRWNPAVQARQILDSPFFVPALTLPRGTCFHSASSVLAVRISCRVTTVFVFRKPLFIN